MSIQWKPIYDEDYENLKNIKYLVSKYGIWKPTHYIPTRTIFKINRILLCDVRNLYDLELETEDGSFIYRVKTTFYGLKASFIIIEGDASLETVKTLYGR